MDIGSKIKQLRIKAGMTQEQLASTLGISAQAVSKWENGTTMPDITLLPMLSTEFGVTIDDLFDLSIDQKLSRIDRRMDLEEDFSHDVFSEYESFLGGLIDDYSDKYRVLTLLAALYHHRMESDSRRVSKYAREAIALCPEKKGCQYLLQKAEGAACWDWNISNRTSVIEFYKAIADSDSGEKTNMHYYDLIDNLLADHRADEAEHYLNEYKKLPSHRPFLIPVYESYVALARYDVRTADSIMESALADFESDSGFLFESAQYYARRCDYGKAIDFYERSFAIDEKKPRYTDALEGIATVYVILGNKDMAIKTYQRMIRCIKDEWGYKSEDAAVIEVERKIKHLRGEV